MVKKEPTKKLIEEYNSLPPDDETKAIIGQELKARGIIDTDADGLLPPQIDLKAQREKDKPTTASVKEYLKPISEPLKEYLAMLDEEEPVVEEPVEEPVVEPAVEEPTVEPTEERTEERAARPDSSGMRQMTLENYERPDVDRVINDIIYYAEMFDDNFADKIPGMRRVEGRPTPLIAIVSQEQAFDVGTEEHPTDQFKPRQITAGDRKRAKERGISTADLYQPHSDWDKSADRDVDVGNATGAARGIYQRQPNGTLSAVRFLIQNEDLANGIFKEAKTELDEEDFVTLRPIMQMIAEASEAAEAKRAAGQYKNTVDSLSEPIEDEVTKLISTGYYPHLDTIMHLAYVAALDKRIRGYGNLQQSGGTNYQNINDIQGSTSGDKDVITSRAIRLVEKYMNK